MQKQISYCRLEIYCLYNIKGGNFTREVSLCVQHDAKLKDVEDYQVYVEEYEDFTSVRNRIVELGEIWKERYPEIEIPWTEEERQACYSGEKENSFSIYISVLLYNRWRDRTTIGVSHAGWIIPGVSFYTKKYDRSYEKLGDKYFHKQRMFSLFTPQINDYAECEFIFSNSACLFIEEWLNTGKSNIEFLKLVEM